MRVYNSGNYHVLSELFSIMSADSSEKIVKGSDFSEDIDFKEGASRDSSEPVFMGSHSSRFPDGVIQTAQRELDDLGKEKEKESKYYGCILYPERDARGDKDNGASWSYEKNIAFWAGAMSQGRAFILVNPIENYRRPTGTVDEMLWLYDNGYKAKQHPENKGWVIFQPPADVLERAHTFRMYRNNSNRFSGINYMGCLQQVKQDAGCEVKQTKYVPPHMRSSSSSDQRDRRSYKDRSRSRFDSEWGSSTSRRFVSRSSRRSSDSRDGYRGTFFSRSPSYDQKRTSRFRPDRRSTSDSTRQSSYKPRRTATVK